MVAVNELSWEEISAPDFGTAARQAFRAAVADVAAKAKATLPACHGRVDAAVKMVLAGDVELLDDGQARVASGYSAQATYLVAGGTCECKDFPQAPSGWCTHRIAAGLMMRAAHLADTLLHQSPPTPPAYHLADTEGGLTLRQGPAEVAHAAAPLPEAPASVNCHVTIGGRQVQVTLRDSDETRLLQRLAAVLAQYPVEQASPAPVAPPIAQAPQPTPEGWCLVHGLSMKLNNNERGKWYSHKTADGEWCKGKGK